VAQNDAGRKVLKITIEQDWGDETKRKKECGQGDRGEEIRRFLAHVNKTGEASTNWYPKLGISKVNLEPYSLATH